jgi:hypothetical protein
MDAIESFEKIAEQTKFSINVEARTHHVRGPGRKLGWGLGPNIERAAAAREKPLPVPSPSPPDPVSETHTSEITLTGVEVSCYSELMDGIKARLAELGIRQADFDMLAGWAEGLAGKVFGPSQVRRLGPEKLFDAIRAAGLKLRLEADPEQLEKMQKQIAENCRPRQATQVRPHNQANLDQRTVDRVLIYLTTKKGGLARLHDAVKDARSNWARHAARARHAKAKPRFGKGIGQTYTRALPPPDDRTALVAEGWMLENSAPSLSGVGVIGMERNDLDAAAPMNTKCDCDSGNFGASQNLVE